jgi:hypothetical protein
LSGSLLAADGSRLGMRGAVLLFLLFFCVRL